jgi:hypothetical protein
MSLQIKIPHGYSAAIAIRPYQNWTGMKINLEIAPKASIKDDYDDEIVDHGPVPDFEDSLTCPSCQGCAVVCSC